MVVTKVIDGDTLFLKNGQVVRLLAVDAPELENCGGREAKALLERLVFGKSVLLEDVLMDKSARVIATVIRNGKNISLELIKSGWLRYDSGKVRDYEEMRKASRNAKSNHLGVFSEQCRQTTNKENPKCTVKGNHVKGESGKRYSFPGCSEYEATVVELDLGEQWFCSEEEAVAAGYDKAANCYGKSYP